MVKSPPDAFRMTSLVYVLGSALHLRWGHLDPWLKPLNSERRKKFAVNPERCTVVSEHLQKQDQLYFTREVSPPEMQGNPTSVTVTYPAHTRGLCLPLTLSKRLVKCYLVNWKQTQPKSHHQALLPNFRFPWWFSAWIHIKGSKWEFKFCDNSL